MNQESELFKSKFENQSVKKQISYVNKQVAKYNKVKGTSLFLQDNRNDSHKVNWSVIEMDGQKIPFDYDDRLWVIALRFACGYHGIVVTA